MKLFKQPCEFVAGAATVESLPPMTHPEVALAGRSNVGKSSLVNLLTGRKSLARTSQNPGHTQQINFFLLGEKLMLADMPGYGFAAVSKKQKGDWDYLIGAYLRGRQNLKRVCLLIDSRRGIMDTDEEMMKLLDEMAVSYQIVLTKSDTLKEAELQEVLQSTLDKLKCHPAAYPKLLATSSKDRRGINELQACLAEFAK